MQLYTPCTVHLGSRDPAQQRHIVCGMFYLALPHLWSAWGAHSHDAHHAAMSQIWQFKGFGVSAAQINYPAAWGI